MALLNASVKIVDSVVYHRMLKVVAPRLDCTQFAFRSESVAEMCLTEMMVALRRALRRGRFVYLASFDVHGA